LTTKSFGRKSFASGRAFFNIAADHSRPSSVGYGLVGNIFNCVPPGKAVKRPVCQAAVDHGARCGIQPLPRKQRLNKIRFAL
jgi:hypothetical protein